jgi:hypothetical protein
LWCGSYLCGGSSCCGGLFFRRWLFWLFLVLRLLLLRCRRVSSRSSSVLTIVTLVVSSSATSTSSATSSSALTWFLKKTRRSSRIFVIAISGCRQDFLLFTFLWRGSIRNRRHIWLRLCWSFFGSFLILLHGRTTLLPCLFISGGSTSKNVRGRRGQWLCSFDGFGTGC